MSIVRVGCSMKLRDKGEVVTVHDPCGETDQELFKGMDTWMMMRGGLWQQMRSGENGGEDEWSIHIRPNDYSVTEGAYRE
jgi:hypothetical protein